MGTSENLLLSYLPPMKQIVIMLLLISLSATPSSAKSYGDMPLPIRRETMSVKDSTSTTKAKCCLETDEGTIATKRHTRLRTHSTMIGLGSNNQLDTYLSPLEYTGWEVRLLQENRRPTRLLSGRVEVQHLIQANYSYTHSLTRDTKYHSGLLEWQAAWHYRWQVLPWLRLLAGPQLGLHAGFVYSTRNGNNPAQARLSGDLNASGMAIANLRLWGHPVEARYQGDLLLAGLMFAPQYGQSYYEIFSLDQPHHNVCFVWPGAAVTYSQLLTLDIPLGTAALRIGYQGVIRQYRANHIKMHDWQHLLLLGYVKRFELVNFFKE